MWEAILIHHLKADNHHYLEERERERRAVRHCAVHVYAHARAEARATRGGFILEVGYLIS